MLSRHSPGARRGHLDSRTPGLLVTHQRKDAPLPDRVQCSAWLSRWYDLSNIYLSISVDRTEDRPRHKHVESSTDFPVSSFLWERLCYHSCVVWFIPPFYLTNCLPPLCRQPVRLDCSCMLPFSFSVIPQWALSVYILPHSIASSLLLSLFWFFKKTGLSNVLCVCGGVVQCISPPAPCCDAHVLKHRHHH